MSEEALKPCPAPWCASAIVKIAKPNRYQHVVCQKCGCQGPACETDAGAIAAWNARAPDPRVTALVEALERLEKLTPKAANAGTAHELYCTVSAIAASALATFKEGASDA